MQSKHTNSKRTDADYINESFAKGLSVLEALEGMNFEPVNVQRITTRTGLSYDFCMRALRTLRWKGYAEETLGGWRLTAKFLRFAERYHELCLTAVSHGVERENHDYEPAR